MSDYRTTHECAGCGREIRGSHAVRDGERYCYDCEDPLVEPSDREPDSVGRRRQIGVGELMEQGDPR